MASVPQPPSRLSDAEVAARDRQRERASWALRHPTRVVNPHAMRDVLVDALPGELTIGGVRRGMSPAEPMESFDWGEVVDQVDMVTAEAIERVLHPPVVAPRRRRMRGPIPASSDRRRARYVEAVIEGECDRVRDTAPGRRNNELASAAFKVGQVACDGEDAFDRLLDAAHECGLSTREAAPTIRSGLRAGCRRPREAA